VKNQFEPLEHGEVISIRNADRVLVGHHTFRVEELASTIKTQLQNAMSDWNADKDDWFTSKGIDCEALRFGSNGWQKGRIRLCLEFCPDEGTESTLDRSDTIPVPPTFAVDATTETTVAPIGSPAPTPVGAATLGAIGLGAVAASAIAPPVIAEIPAVEPSAVAPTPAPEEIPVVEPSAVAPTPAPEEIAAVEPSVTIPEPSPSIASDIAAISQTIEELENEPLNPAVTPADLASLDIAENVSIDDSTLPPIEPVSLVSNSDAGFSIANNAVNPDEISFDFSNDSFNLGSLSLDGKMDLDSTDLAIDNNEFIDFEPTGNNTVDRSNDNNSTEIDRPENSGMLIDEVWSELHQSNNSWPSVNRS
jgi:hypothetical protein